MVFARFFTRVVAQARGGLTGELDLKHVGSEVTRCRAAIGPAQLFVTSNTFKPVSGPADVSFPREVTVPAPQHARRWLGAVPP